MSDKLLAAKSVKRHIENNKNEITQGNEIQITETHSNVFNTKKEKDNYVQLDDWSNIIMII